MARKSKYKKQDLVTVSLDLVREGGMNSISARNLTKKLGATQATIFTHYSSMDELKNDVVEEIKRIYDSYVEEGLAMNPPFKGFGMKTLEFAKKEPELYKVLFYQDTKINEIDDLLVAKGHLDAVLNSIITTFDVTKEQAEEIYKNIALYSRGVENLAVNSNVALDEIEIARLYGMAARAFVTEAKTPKDDRFKVVPKKK